MRGDAPGRIQRPVRVLQLGSPTGLYGAERWILALARNLDSSRIETIVSVIIDDPTLDGDLCLEAEKLGIPTRVFRSYGKVNLAAITQLKNFIRKRRVDIVHTHGYKTDVIGLLATAGTGCRIVSTPHGWSRKAGLKLMAYECLDRAVFPFFDAVVPLSEEIHDGLKRVPFLKKKLHLIPNGVDLADAGEGQDVAERILEWKAQGLFVFGYIGQLIPRKGLDVLIRALSLLDFADWRCCLLGDGEEEGELRQLVRDLQLDDKVHFLGFRKDRMAFLRGFDAFVLPSRLEGIPRCLMEAMAAGIPVVASDIPGCRDLVKHDATGLLFTCEDHDDLRMKLTELVSNSFLRSQLASNARGMVESRWSASMMASKYLQLYVDLLNG